MKCCLYLYDYGICLQSQNEFWNNLRSAWLCWGSVVCWLILSWLVAAHQTLARFISTVDTVPRNPTHVLTLPSQTLTHDPGLFGLNKQCCWWYNVDKKPDKVVSRRHVLLLCQWSKVIPDYPSLTLITNNVRFMLGQHWLLCICRSTETIPTCDNMFQAVTMSEVSSTTNLCFPLFSALQVKGEATTYIDSIL